MFKAENAPFSPQLASGAIGGLTNYANSPEAVNVNRHYDFGQKSVDIWTDMVVGDMALSTSTYGWYNATGNLQVTTDFSREENQIIWDFYFKRHQRRVNIGVEIRIIHNFGMKIDFIFGILSLYSCRHFLI